MSDKETLKSFQFCCSCKEMFKHLVLAQGSRLFIEKGLSTTLKEKSKLKLLGQAVVK